MEIKIRNGAFEKLTLQIIKAQVHIIFYSRNGKPKFQF